MLRVVQQLTSYSGSPSCVTACDSAMAWPVSSIACRTSCWRTNLATRDRAIHFTLSRAGLVMVVGMARWTHQLVKCTVSEQAEHVGTSKEYLAGLGACSRYGLGLDIQVLNAEWVSFVKEV
jgi:hypothetical protein